MRAAGREPGLKTAYHVVMNLLGAGCIASCIAIVVSLGQLDIHWSGWVAVAFFAALTVGIMMGWFPWRGKPLRVMLKGFYVMSALALVGFGFKLSDPMRPPLWLVLTPVAAAMIGRAVYNGVTHARSRANAE